jgi:hypothetical protein
MSDSPAPQSPEVKAEAPRRARRWKKWLFRGALSVFLSLLCYYGWVLGNRELTRRQSERELAATVADVEASDPDWTWERLTAARKRPPEAKNGADLIPQIKKLSHADWGKELAKEEWKPRLETLANVRFSPAVIAVARGELAASASAVKLARTLNDYPLGHREIVLKPDVWNTLLEDTVNTRHTADLLRWDVVIAVEDGNERLAADDLLALLNASRSVGDEPFLICQLIRAGVRVVAVRSTEWFLAQAANPPSLAEFQAALAADAEEPLLLYGMRGDRAATSKLFENLDNGTATPEKSLEWSMNDPWTRLGWWHFRAHLPADHAAFLRLTTQYVEYARLPIHEQPKYFTSLPIPEKDPRRILSSLLLPAAERVANSYWRTTAEARCAVVGIACERFRRQHGRWPDTLAELVPAFIPEVPLDPFNAEPLRFAKSEDGVVVYSVGKRLPSEFGKPAVRPELPEGVEIGFRLWDPDRRRLPPPPDPVEPAQNP